LKPIDFTTSLTLPFSDFSQNVNGLLTNPFNFQTIHANTCRFWFGPSHIVCPTTCLREHVLVGDPSWICSLSYEFSCCNFHIYAFSFCVECILTSGSTQAQQLAPRSSSVPSKVYSSWIFGNGPKVHIGVGCDSCGVMLLIFNSLCLSCLIIANVVYICMNKIQSQMHDFL
jgi:hypothetical protein